MNTQFPEDELGEWGSAVDNTLACLENEIRYLKDAIALLSPNAEAHARITTLLEAENRLGKIGIDVDKFRTEVARLEYQHNQLTQAFVNAMVRLATGERMTILRPFRHS